MKVNGAWGLSAHNILPNNSICVPPKKESHTGLSQYEGE